MQDLVPCVLVTFDKEQIVVWRGNDYKYSKDGYFLKDRESFDDDDDGGGGGGGELLTDEDEELENTSL